MRNHAPLLPYVIAFWMGIALGIGTLELGEFILFIWVVSGIWMGFKWSLKFTHIRFVFFIGCTLLGYFRADSFIVHVPNKSGDLIVLSLQSCKPKPLNYGKNIYGYAITREMGKVGIVWPSRIEFPSRECVALGI